MDKLVDVEIDSLKHETDAAWLVVVGKKEAWIPKSQAEFNNDSGTLTLPEWLAIEKEIV